MKFEYSCPREQDTVRVGEALASIAKKGDVFLLEGTLGMGKTVLARAFIQKLTKAKEVPSPTFTLVQSYSGKNSEIYHFDLYRIKNPIEIFELGIEEALYGGISLIEWPSKMGSFIPRDAFKIEIIQKGDGRIVNIEVTSFDKAARLESIDV